MRRKICALHRHLQLQVLAAKRAQGGASLSEVDRITRADVIYRVDQFCEEIILQWFQEHWPAEYPVELVMEGLEKRTPTTFPPGLSPSRTLIKCIIDPVDGTRPYMYDKRSAWILTGLAPQRLQHTTLADIEVAAMTELPCAKQYVADQLSTYRGEGVVSCRLDVATGRHYPWEPQPYAGTELAHGFYSVVKYFPTGKVLLANFEELLIDSLDLNSTQHGAEVFEDQYLSTGGQIYELAAGCDRFTIDLRPLVNQYLRRPQKLSTHPYDICTALILEELGGVVEQPDGSPLDAPLDTETPVPWVAYANRELAERLRPYVGKAIEEAFYSQSTARLSSGAQR